MKSPKETVLPYPAPYPPTSDRWNCESALAHLWPASAFCVWVPAMAAGGVAQLAQIRTRLGNLSLPACAKHTAKPALESWAYMHKWLRFNKSPYHGSSRRTVLSSLSALFTYQCGTAPCRTCMPSINSQVYCISLASLFPQVPAYIYFSSPFSPYYAWLSYWIPVLGIYSLQIFVDLSHCLWATTSPSSMYFFPH